MKRFLYLASLLLVLALIFTGCSIESTETPKKSNYTLNETVAFKNLKFIATEIIESSGTTLLSPDEGNTFVGVKFTVENISSEDQSLSSLLCFTAYCDEIKVDYSISASTAFDGSLDGDIAAGKKLVGYYGIEVPKNWNIIEIEVKPELLSNKSATFVFENSQITDSHHSNKESTNQSDSNNTSNTDTPQKTTYGLNETVTLGGLKFTATEVSESSGSTFLHPAEGKTFIGIKFTIENVSESTQTVSSLLLFSPYCDDVKTDYSFSASSAFEGSLDGDIASGKKMVGFYGIEVPKDWNTIEINVKSDWTSNDSASFVFNKQ